MKVAIAEKLKNMNGSKVWRRLRENGIFILSYSVHDQMTSPCSSLERDYL